MCHARFTTSSAAMAARTPQRNLAGNWKCDSTSRRSPTGLTRSTSRAGHRLVIGWSYADLPPSPVGFPFSLLFLLPGTSKVHPLFWLDEGRPITMLLRCSMIDRYSTGIPANSGSKPLSKSKLYGELRVGDLGPA